MYNIVLQFAMTRSMTGKRRVSHTASHRCNKNAIIVFHWIFDFMMNQLKKSERKAVRWWMGWIYREWGTRSCKTSIYSEIRQKKTERKKQWRYARCQDITGWYNLAARFFLFIFLFFAFALHLISPQPFLYCSSTDLAWSWTATNLSEAVGEITQPDRYI